MDTSKFIKYFKEQVKAPVLDIFRQYENIVEAKTKAFDIPSGENPQHKFIHGKIFEDCVHQAASNCMEDRKLKEEFINLYGEFCENRRSLDQYMAGMKQAGSTAWNIIRYMQLQHVSFTFGKRIPNTHFTMLKPNLLIDFIQPTLLYDFKLSTLKSQEEYENKYLINGILQVCIYYLCLGLAPDNVRLGVLVFFSTLNKVVFYSTDIYKDGFCVNLLKEKMTANKHSEDSDSDTMPALEALTLQ